MLLSASVTLFNLLFLFLQTTMVFMLNHLKRVTLRSDVNKMTSKDLGVCLGPAMFCPSSQTEPDQQQWTTNLGKYIQLLQYILDIWPPANSGIVIKNIYLLTVNLIWNTKFKPDNRYAGGLFNKLRRSDQNQTTRNSLSRILCNVSHLSCLGHLYLLACLLNFLLNSYHLFGKYV